MSSKKRISTRELEKLATKYRATPSVTLEAAEQALIALDCPRSLAVWILMKNEPSQLKTLGFDPLHYNDVVTLRDSYAATKLLSKADFLDIGVDTAEAAMDKFWKTEVQCESTNRRFARLDLDPLFKGPNVWLLNAFTRKISDVLVGYSQEELFGLAKWGPGATTRIKGRDASAFNKFQQEAGITRDMYRFVSPFLVSEYPTWSSHLEKIGFPRYDTGNKLTTVPKDAFTDRVIAIEPGVNLWFQLAIGQMIRKRLRVHGIDLSTQKRNQQLACEGSKTSSLATVDFSSASDTVSRELVMGLFPPHWAELLFAARSHYGMIDGKPHRWAKFSSMGNGFTFELESLIFYAAAMAVCEYLKLDTSSVSVFGDDVILPSSAFSLFSSFTEFLGFTVNKSKSYTSDSAFRESCGAHYYDGIDVKPIYLKSVALTVHQLYALANKIREWAHRRVSNLACDVLLKKCWLTVVLAIPKSLRIFGSFGFGDNYLIGNLDEADACIARENKHYLGSGTEGYLCWQFAQVAIELQSEEIGILLTRLHTGSVQEYGNSYTLRGRTRIRRTRMLVHRWYSLGSWI